MINIRSVSRTPSKATNGFLVGFTKALGLLHTLNRKTTMETRSTVECMAMEGVLSAAEKDAVAEYYGWGR